MKSIFNILIVLSVVLAANSAHAQIKNPQTETVKVFGNCELCKTAIENAGNIKNTASVIWNKDTKMAEITFDSKKTNRDEILKRIALAGYDNDQFLAPDNAYAQLAECCKYERLNKAPVMVMTKSKSEMEMHEPKMEMNMPTSKSHTDMVMPEPKGEMNMPSSENHTDMVMSEMMVANPLDAIFDTYFAINDALVKTDATTAKAKATELLNAIKSLKTETLKTEEQTAVTKILPSIMDAAKSISETKDIGKQREKFKFLSKSMHKIISFYNSQETLYYQYCPMQDANWLSKDKAIKNPYYGSQMLSCGSTVETIKNKN
jgi:copper chaperone CopZ